MGEYLKLYKITLQGLQWSTCGIVYGISYVVAEDANKAYQKVLKYVNENNLGFERERELKTIELIADSDPDTTIKHLLHSHSIS